MLKIKPLNKDSFSDEDIPVLRKELQEEMTLEMYNKALRLQAKEEYREAKNILFKLINENIPQLDSQGALPKSMSTLKYSCYLNIGNIYLSLNKNSKALKNFLEASELDQSDVSLWYKIGKLALQENQFNQSIYAFSKGLDCNTTHWPCLDQIIPLLFAVNDTVGCLYYVGKALMLDENYTKGLVIRKEIYLSNPAASEYYPKCNPDSVGESPVDVEISKEEELKYLKEVQCIISKINEGEKLLKSQPLSVISLPKALGNYTWLDISESIITLYEYIKSNKLSFFTCVDVNKCMSYTAKDEIVEEDNEKPSSLDPCVAPGNSENIKNEDKKEKIMDIDSISVRRSSQNSEENGSQPQSSDFNEEHDIEDQDDKNGTTRPRSYKRKRDLLLDLRVWGWHSKRKNVRKSKPDKFYTIEDCLNQILPPHLLQNKVGYAYSKEDTSNNLDKCGALQEEKNMNILSPVRSPEPKNLEMYFGTDSEKEDVIKSWSRSREFCNICVLVKEFVLEISKLWKIRWPEVLIVQYIETYEIYREFYELPNIFDNETLFEDIRNEALMTLLYAEFVLFSCPKNMAKDRMLHIGQIQFLEIAVSCWEENWGEDYIPVLLRVLWLRAYIFRKEGVNDSAVRFLRLIGEVIDEEETRTQKNYSLVLQNCNKCSLITLDVTTKILRHLDLLKSISCIEEFFNQEKYVEVIDIVKSTFESNSGYPTFEKIGRPAQLGMLLHSLWFTDFDECFIWAEACLFEALPQYTRPGLDRTRWEKIVEKCLSILHEIIKQKTRSVVNRLHTTKKARLVESLAKIICKQINTDTSANIPLNTVSPWILLHHLLANDEENELSDKLPKDCKLGEDLNNDTIPTSLSIIFFAHEFLGPKGWCMSNQGELLHFLLDVLLDRGEAYKFERFREKIDLQIEQAFFCLYQHPSKKNKISRHLADHNVDPIPLTWEKSFQLYEFYAPEVLPEFNSFKNASITLDLEQLLLRITALVTPECEPLTSTTRINEYLQGKCKEIPEPLEFPNRMRAIYYLLGDYYFKLRDFVRCVKYFLMDLAINPTRVDSWACLALSFFSQLEIKLNFCKKIKSEEEFLELAKCAQVGFKTSLKLSPQDITLWIEFGTFEYMAHSFCSRYLKYESENMSIERFEYLENQKNAYLDSSGQSFEKAIALYEMNDNEPDERWLQYYILGKIAEKRQTEPREYLNYYLTASQLLHENNAEYPDKIMYNAPQHLSVEALELYYRINASILKYLECHEGKMVPTVMGSLFKKTLDALAINRNLSAQKAKKKLEKSSPIKAKSSIQENCYNKETSISDQVDPVQNVPCKEVTTENKEAEIEDATIDEIQRDVKESIDNLLQKIEDMESRTDDKNEPVVQIVDEVILVDAEYDIIMILSSDEDDDCNSPNPKTTSNSQSNHIPAIEEMNTEQSLSNTNLSNHDKQEKDPSNINQSLNTIDRSIENKVDENNKIQSDSDTLQAEKPKETSEGVDLQKEFDEIMRKTMEDVYEQQIEIDSETSINDKNVEIIECTNVETGTNIIEKTLDVTKEQITHVEIETGNKLSAEENNEFDEMMRNTKEDAPVQQIKTDSETNINNQSVEVMECSTIETEVNATEKSLNITEEQKSHIEIESEDKLVAEENNKLTADASTSSSSSGSSGSSSSSDADSDDDSSVSSSSLSSESSSSENLSNYEILHLTDRCIRGLEQCIIRMPKNYKAAYRLVHLFYYYKARKDLNKCKQLLLTEYKCYEETLIAGLFADRKAANFFNGIWRIPSSEIDRPGSLASHMSRCVTILLQVLGATNDSKILLELYFQLKKSPDPDKVYIKDSERIQFSEQALSLCLQSFRNNIRNTDKMDNAAIRKLLHDLYKAYVRIQKVPEKDSVFSQMLIEVYKSFIKEKIPEGVNILELAIKFCQQTKLMERQKNLSLIQNMSLRNPAATTGPVLPTPMNVNATENTSFKCHYGVGRPRGRPPLHYTSGQMKSTKPKSRTSAFPSQTSTKKSVSEATSNQEYITHYKEELIKQYNHMAHLVHMYQDPKTFLNSYIQQSNALNTNILNEFPALDTTYSDKKNTPEVIEVPTKINEILSLVKKGQTSGNLSTEYLKESTPKNSTSSKQERTSLNHLQVKPIDTPPSQESKDKSKEDSKFAASNIDLIELPKNERISTQIKDASRDHLMQREKKEPMPDSTIPKIPRDEKSILHLMQREKKEPMPDSTIPKIPRDEKSILHSDSTRVIKLNEPEIITFSKSSDIMKKVASPVTVATASPFEFPNSSSFSSTSIPSSSSFMPPPLPISSLSFSSGRKTPSPIISKGSCTIVPKSDIESTMAKISPYSDIRPVCQKRNKPSKNLSMSNFIVEPNLGKYHSNLSLSSANMEIKQIAPSSQHVITHNISPKKTQKVGYTSHDSSSDTTQAFLPKANVENKQTVLRNYSNTNIEMSKIPTIKCGPHVKQDISKLFRTDMECPAPPAGFALPSKNVFSSNISDQKGSRTDFSIESMLPSSLRPIASTSTYGYSIPSTLMTTNSSVITKTNASVPENKSCSRTSPICISPIGTSVDSVIAQEKKNIVLSSSSSKLQTYPRTSPSGMYQIDETRSYDRQKLKHDESLQIPKHAKGVSTSVITAIPKPSSYVQSYLPTSPVKTLQEKLAEKKIKQANMQLNQEIEQHKARQQQAPHHDH